MSRLFCCPVCGRPLVREPARYLCPAGHSFDRAAEGYVHLLPSDRMRAKVPGDSPEMVRARRDFLAAGHYAFLADAVAEALAPRLADGGLLFDAGCGEGYYTRRVREKLAEAGVRAAAAGVDVAKTAVRMAAKKVPDGEFAVASLYRLPVADGCADAVMNVFSPLCIPETRRILKPGGVFLYVVPAARHLFEMKCVLYPEPYENEEKTVPYEGFRLEEVRRAERVMALDAAALQNLFAMTPYFWKTPREGARRLSALDALSVTAAFRLHIYRKED